MPAVRFRGGMEVDAQKGGRIHPFPVDRMAMRQLSVVATLLVLLAAPAAGQTAACPAPADTSRPPDVVIVASAQIDQLRFESAPQLRLSLLGCDSVRVTERRNLPNPVQPGVTYRDVGIGIEIRSWLNVQCLPRAAGAAADSALARALAGLCKPARPDSARSAPRRAAGP